MGQQALVQLAGEKRDAVHPGVVTKPMAGHADLAAVTSKEDLLIEIGPLLDGLLQGTTGSRGGTAEVVSHGCSLQVRLY